MSEAIDSVRKIFKNHEGELRSGWRVFVFFVLYQLLFLLLDGFLFVIGEFVPMLKHLLRTGTDTDDASWFQLFGYMLIQVESLLPVLIANAICARWLERRSFLSTGFKLHKGWWRDFIFGLVFGAITLTVAVALSAALGATTFSARGNSTTFLIEAFLFMALFFLISAANEEALVRGFMFQALAHNIGPAAALVITSTIFGLLHLANPNITFFSTLNTILAGVWLGVAYLVTRSLWLAVALHMSWNFVMVFVFGLPVSGIVFFKRYSWLTGEALDKAWISGGTYGPEGGAAATVALLACTLALWKSGLFSTTQEMIEAIKHGKHEPERVSLFAKDADDSQA
jgi:membrane protease YdiL (CAAX protease family)